MSRSFCDSCRHPIAFNVTCRVCKLLRCERCVENLAFLSFSDAVTEIRTSYFGRKRDISQLDSSDGIAEIAICYSCCNALRLFLDCDRERVFEKTKKRSISEIDSISQDRSSTSTTTAAATTTTEERRKRRRRIFEREKEQNRSESERRPKIVRNVSSSSGRSFRTKLGKFDETIANDFYQLVFDDRS